MKKPSKRENKWRASKKEERNVNQPKQGDTTKQMHRVSSDGERCSRERNPVQPSLEVNFRENSTSMGYASQQKKVQVCMSNSVEDFVMTTRGLLATDHVILNHGQVTWTTPEMAPPSPNYHTTPTGGRFSSRQI
ncbi:hypothetical protein TNCV_2138611 [Trichonephila clavipes]|nr:hypothetical protein TNCV_2138611 [Trichonephila clavipes]